MVKKLGLLAGTVALIALGVTMFELATGRLPFGGATTAEILEQHIHRPAPLLPVSIVPESTSTIAAKLVAFSR